MKQFGAGVMVGAVLAATAAVAQGYASVNTNGVLKGYVVQKDGKEVCRDPSVWNNFRGQGSFIVCD